MDVLLTNYGDVTAVQFAAVFAILVLIMGALLLGTNLKDKWWPKEEKPKKPLPSPLPVELVKSLATLDELKELRAEMNQGINAIRLEMKNDDDDIHRRVGAISIKLADAVGKLDVIAQNLQLLITKEVSK